jgi:hypothetical protein
VAARITVAELEAILAIQDRMSPKVPGMVAAVDKVKNAVEKLPPVLDQWTNAQQRAAQKMERLHEEAIKMNTGFKAADDKAQLFSQTLSRVSTTATASAAALGLPIGRLNELSSVIDVAGIGFNNLTKSAVGFNAASVAVVGAGLAVGAMIGTLIRQLPGAAEAYDSLAVAALNYFGILAKNTGPATTNVAAMGAIAAKVQQNVINLMRSQGKTTDQIVDQLTGKVKTMTDVVVDGLRKQDVAEAKATAAAKRAAEEKQRAAQQYAAAYARALEMVYNSNLRVINQMRDAGWDEFKRNVVIITNVLEQQAEAAKKISDAEERLQAIREANAEEEKARDAAILAGKYALADAILNLGQVTSGVFASMISLAGGFLLALARIQDQTVRNQSATQKWAGVANAGAGALSGGSVLGGAIGGAVAGAAFGPLGAGIGAVAGGLLGLFSHAKKAREEFERMRAEFLRSSGGLQQLEIAAEHAGVSLQAFFDARSAEALSRAIADINRQLDLTALAERKLNEAMERYGLTIEDMGAKFAQQRLDEQALQLWSDWEMLNAAMGDTTAILTKMAPTMQEYIDTALKAGSTIPENLRPIIEQMIKLGLLTDESGVAFGSLEEAGLNFGAAIEDSMKAAADAVLELVKVLRQLYGLPAVNIPVNVPGLPGGGDGSVDNGGGGREGRRHLREFISGGRVDPDPRVRVPGTGGGQLAIVHPGELVIPPGGESALLEKFGNSAAINRLSGQVADLAARPPQTITYAPTLVVKDESIVKTAEGVQEFERVMIPMITRAVSSGKYGLRAAIIEATG